MLVTLFVGISFFSVGYILIASSNYANYYWQARSAVTDPESNNTYVKAVVVTKDLNTGQIVVRVSVSATNPTNYSGLTLRSFAIVLFFIQSGNINQSIFQNSQLLANSVLDRPLDPKSTVSTDLFLSLSSTESSSFRTFNQTYSGVDAHVVLTTAINSFLDPVYGIMTTVKEQEIRIS